METYHGKSIFNGIAIGKICKYEKEQQQVKRIRISDPEAEISRFDHAREEAGAQLQALYDKALTQVGESGAMIFEIHRMMLDDDDYLDSVYHIIRSQQVNAEFAVASTGDNFSRLFASMDDEYMQGRAADVKDISDRLIRILMGQTDKHDIMEPVIIMAEDLAPSETVQMDKDNLLAFVTTLGSSNSHTAILARTMGIPALVGIPVRDEWNGKTAIVDGHSGTLIIEPDDALLAGMQEKKEEELRQKQLLAELKGKETITKSGKKINLYANIGNVSDVGAALANDAGGIGLFRSEFLYLEAQDYPTEEEQFQAYKKVAEAMDGKRVIMIDDSIVRGTQLRETVDFLYESGAKEVHMRSACPPIMYGCKYLNFSRSNSEMELIARRTVQNLEGDEGQKHLDEYADGTTQRGKCMLKAICEEMGFDSLGYQSLDGLLEAIGLDKDKVCTYCWNGKE